jgi:twitching motility protein PilT
MGQQVEPQAQPQNPPPEAMKEIDKLFAASMKTGASDVHLKVGSPPLFRIHGTIVRAKLPPLTMNHIRQLIGEIMGPKELQALEDVGSADFAHGVKGVGRFRVNVFKQRGAISMAARRVQTDIPTIEQLNLPEGVKIVPTYESGLVIVAGVTGSGKSTTLAALIEIMNQTQAMHIITIENPIEYLYRDSKSFINQREVGLDCVSFYDGLKYAVRQDPDVILVGEMRDEDTVETALMAAETGHLVFGTVHASNAAGTIGRILDFFPVTKHHQVRQLLFFNLKAIVVQKLLRGARPDVPRVPAVELMLVNPMIKKLIFDSEDNKIPDVIRSSRQEGMQDINQSLMDLVFRGLITEQVALENSPNAEQLAMNLKGIVLGSDRGSLVG